MRACDGFVLLQIPNLALCSEAMETFLALERSLLAEQAVTEEVALSLLPVKKGRQGLNLSSASPAKN